MAQGFNVHGGTNYCQEPTKRWDYLPEDRRPNHGLVCLRPCDPGETVCRVHLAARNRSRP